MCHIFIISDYKNLKKIKLVLFIFNDILIYFSHSKSSYNMESVNDESKQNLITIESKGNRMVLDLDIARNEAFIEEMIFNQQSEAYQSLTEMAIFLKSVEEKVKVINIKNIIQPVSEDDWNRFLKNIPEFKYVKTARYPGGSHVNVSIDVDNFAIAITKGLGFK